MEHLFEKLFHYGEGTIYPYHMPGHKRQSWGELPESLYKKDITEIEGFDNLHQPEGILLELQREAARIYGAEESYYLVNGSTCGILSAVSCALPFGGHILMARNCHKSAYHAAYLRHLKTNFLYPRELEEYDTADAITPRQVQEALEKKPDTEAVLIVSPTYEGRIADVSAIAGIVHERGIPLIVDEAHGAHLGLAEGFAKNSCQAGADLVIHSVHKTLPALTQSALLHVNGSLVDRNRLRRYLHIYQTSSPSYLLMASIDNALQYAEAYQEAFARFRTCFAKMTDELTRCRYLKVLKGKQEEQDVGKLLISVKGTGLTGKSLYDILLSEYGLQVEMASVSFILAMFTVNDSPEAYERMTRALLEIDRKLAEEKWKKDACREKAVCRKQTKAGRVPDHIDRSIDSVPLFQAWDREAEEILLWESAGRHVAEFVNLYPPGVPLLIPGERITETLCHDIQRAVEEGLNVQGIHVRKDGKESTQKILLRVLKQEGGKKSESSTERETCINIGKGEA